MIVTKVILLGVIVLAEGMAYRRDEARAIINTGVKLSKFPLDAANTIDGLPTNKMSIINNGNKKSVILFIPAVDGMIPDEIKLYRRPVKHFDPYDS